MKTFGGFICVMGILTIPILAAGPAVIKSFEVDEFNNVIRPYEADGKGQIIAEKIDFLRLECRANYPVEWVYSGQGLSPSKTDMSLSSSLSTTEGRTYIASLFLGPLKPLNTGRYACSRIDNIKETDKDTPKVYIFVLGDDLFTVTQGKTIQVDPSETSVLLPCAVTHPNVDVTLHKLEGDDFNVPVVKSEDAIKYSTRKGFRMRLKNIEDPEGRYICSARRDGKIKDVEYIIKFRSLFQGDQAAPNKLQVRGEIKCGTHTDCPSTMLCQVGNICVDPCIGRCEGKKCKLVDFAPICYSARQ